MRGHILRVHPEKVPDVVDNLMKSEKDMAALRMRLEREPELWKRLFEFIEDRQRRTSN